jgi:hypothetical protein
MSIGLTRRGRPFVRQEDSLDTALRKDKALESFDGIFAHCH